MVRAKELAVACGTGAGRLITFAAFLLFLTMEFSTIEICHAGQAAAAESERQAAARRAFDAGQWEEAAKLAQGAAEQPADLDFVNGLALARLQRWKEAREALLSGERKAPGDPRFPVELAGVSYKQHDFRAAKRELHAARRLNPQDSYARDFLGTIYFLENNLEAALKYWNALDKPRLASVTAAPPPRLAPALLNRAIGFNSPQVLTGDALLGGEARLANLGIYAAPRVELAPVAGGDYQATLHLAERSGLGGSWWQSGISLLSGMAYDTIYPEVYDIGGRAVNITGQLRWDAEKRRVLAAVSMPLFQEPSRQLRFYFDVRNENWNLVNTFFGGGLPLGDLNVRRIAGGGEFRSVENGKWSWSAGVEVAHRSFRNIGTQTSAAESDFFSDGTSVSGRWGAERSILRLPERRFTVDGSAEARVSRQFTAGQGSFGWLRGELKAHWLPQAKGDDYETQWRIRVGGIAGRAPFDELFQLGIERDNDLWLRGHAGTNGGRKGAAPLGRRYFLANWELDKNIYSNGLLRVKLGPFVDSGAIADASGLFGSREWLVDTGAQCKLSILGSLNVVLSYGRGVRGGHNALYGTVLH